jgi:hypothetical protein
MEKSLTEMLPRNVSVSSGFTKKALIALAVFVFLYNSLGIS